MPNTKILAGDCIESLKQLPDKSVNCCVTSPPYYGLRDYGTATWEGGDPNCSHKRDSKQSALTITGHKNLEGAVGDGIYKKVCKQCGAVRIDKQIGLEESPEDFINKLVEVFREVKRVLKDDGTCWVNMGDSYWGGKGQSGSGGNNYQEKRFENNESLNRGYQTLGEKKETRPTDRKHEFIKPKDLIGIPWMLAFALRADGWYLRQDIIWHKPNPMPESVTDRCTKAHEYIFLLSKSRQYYFDSEAMKEPCVESSIARQKRGVSENNKWVDGALGQTPHSISQKRDNDPNREVSTTRNKRSVWSVNTRSYKEAHFATYPPELIKPCILAGCPDDGVVLDPFGGSGTTAQVAMENNRNAILCELNPDYIKIIENRLNKVDPLFNITE